MDRAIPFSVIGLAVGIVLGLAAAWGLVPFLLVVVFGSIGLAVGRYLDGELDVEGLLSRGRRSR